MLLSQVPPTSKSSSPSVLALSMTWASLSKEASWITGPMKFPHSQGSPTRSFWVSCTTRSLNCGHNDRGTYVLDVALHFCP